MTRTVGTGIDPSGFLEGFVANISPVPEPSTAAMLCVGLLGSGLALRQRRRRAVMRVSHVQPGIGRLVGALSGL